MGIDFNWLEEKVLLRQLDEEEKQLLENLIDVGEFEAGETILEQGEPGGVLYLLRSGEADITVNADSDRVHVATAEEGSMFGEMSFLSGDVASATVTAKKGSVAYKLARPDFSDRMKENQNLVFELFVYILRHASTIIRHMNQTQIYLQQYIMGGRHV